MKERIQVALDGPALVTDSGKCGRFGLWASRFNVLKGNVITTKNALRDFASRRVVWEVAIGFRDKGVAAKTSMLARKRGHLKVL